MEPRYEKQQPVRSPQHQPRQPGIEHERPIFIRDDYRGSGKLENRVALITGGDSGIGRAVAVHYAREGAHIASAYLDEHEDAAETKRLGSKPKVVAVSRSPTKVSVTRR